MSRIEELEKLPNGATLFRELNGAGGFTYFSDEIAGGVAVWDTCLVAESTLIAAIIHETIRSGGGRSTPKAWPRVLADSDVPHTGTAPRLGDYPESGFC